MATPEQWRWRRHASPRAREITLADLSTHITIGHLALLLLFKPEVRFALAQHLMRRRNCSSISPRIGKDKGFCIVDRVVVLQFSVRVRNVRAGLFASPRALT